MKCKIEYIGKLRNGSPNYYCTVHKSSARGKNGIKLDECICNEKELFNNKLDLEKTKIENLKLIYEDLLTSNKGVIYLNNKIFNGVFIYKNYVLTYKDLSGLMLSKLNNIELEKVICNNCKHMHTDNGKFAYTKHKTHMCLYCGHLFKAKEPNIGNELIDIIKIKDIKLDEKIINIDKFLHLEYDLINGKILVNNENINTILLNNKEIKLTYYLNEKLKNEY